MAGIRLTKFSWLSVLLTWHGVCCIYFTRPSYNLCADLRPGSAVGRLHTLQNASRHCNPQDVQFDAIDLDGQTSVGFSLNSSGWLYVESVVPNFNPNSMSYKLQVSVSCATEHSGKVNVTVKPKDQCSCKLPHQGATVTSWISSVCFQQEDLHFIIEENTQSVSIGRVAACDNGDFGPSIERRYVITTDSTVTDDISRRFQVDGNSSEVLLVEAFDREVKDTIEFALQCSVYRNSQYLGITRAKIYVKIGDTNDNPILFQNGADRSTIELNKDQQSQNVVLYDKDLFGCLHHIIRVTNDPRSACINSAIENGYQFKQTICQLKVHVAREKLSQYHEYTCEIVITDPGYRPTKPSTFSNATTLTVNIKMDRTISTPPYAMYNANVARDSTRLTRIFMFTDVSDIPRKYYTDSLPSAFDVTRNEGIVYVDRPALLEAGKQNFTVIAYPANVNEEQKLILTVNVISNPRRTDPCEDSCSIHDGREGCVTACGLGLISATCKWRVGEKDGWTTKYGTCTYDSRQCPNRQCDELEKQNPLLCPQDCTNKTIGTAKLNTEVSPARGIGEAVGNCFCDYLAQCSCWNPKDVNAIGKIGRTDKTTEPHLVANVTTGHRYYQTDDGNHGDSQACDENCRTTIAASLGCLGAVVCVFFLAWYLRKNKCHNGKGIKKRVGSLVSVSAVPSDYQDDRDLYRNYHPSPQWNPKGPMEYTQSPEDMKWEFERENLILDKTLGEGEFGRVVKASAYNMDGKEGYKDVAVKMLKHCASSSELSDLLSEFNLLKDVNHPNVIHLLGACTKDGPFYVIVEYCQYGSLLSYLRRSRLEENGYVNHRYRHKEFRQHCENGEYMEPELLTISHLLSFAWQIAKGMKYLSEIKLVHRDLAARNVLVAAGKVLKISDFGLTRDVYEADTYLKQSKGRIPVKWLAPESLYAQIYTTLSDVWSYGIVLWEIATLGAPPYPGIPPERLYNLLIAGYRMDRPESCTDELYAVMQKCWKTDPTDRPTFIQLTNIFDRLLQQRTEYLDLTGGFSEDHTPDVYDRCFGNASGKVFPRIEPPRQVESDSYGSISVISGNVEPYLTPSSSKATVSDDIPFNKEDQRRVVLSNDTEPTCLHSRKCLDIKDKPNGGEKLALLVDSGTAVFSPISEADEDWESRETDMLSVQAV